MGEVKKSSGLANLSSTHAGATTNTATSIACLIGETGEDILPFIVRIRRSREKNREECSKSGLS